MPSSLESLLCIAYGLVPGHIFISVYSAVTVREQRTNAALVIESVSGSLLFWVVFGPLFLDFGTEIQLVHSLSFISLTGVVVPALVGLVVGYIDSRGWMRKLIGVRSQIPTAWDYRFGLKKPLWVIVTMSDGSRIGGGWHNQSFASSYPSSGDLYIETVFELDESGKFGKPIPQSAGVWISADSIKCIEFFRWEEESDG